MVHLLSPEWIIYSTSIIKPLKLTVWAMNLVITNKINLIEIKKKVKEMRPVIQNMTLF